MVLNNQSELIYINGLNGAEPGYLVEPFTLEELRAGAQALKKKDIESGAVFSSPDHFSALKDRDDQGAAHFDISARANPLLLNQAGWGVIFPAAAEPNQVAAILEAMSELIAWRSGRAGERYKEYSGGKGYRPGDTGDVFCARHGMQPGPVDPTIMPYYLLIIADPQSIPYSFQYELDVQFSVGRIYFDTLDEYANYARSVVQAETPGLVKLPRRAAFFGVANKGDEATQLSARSLIEPLFRTAQEDAKTLGWQEPLLFKPGNYENPDPDAPDAANKANLLRLLGGDQTPALLFTASHGLGWPYGHAHQYPFQGALVTQHWPGPAANVTPDRDMYLGAEDLDNGRSLLGTVAFFFACFGAGTPYWDDYSIAHNKPRKGLAHRAFLSKLPLRMLSHPRGGALAVIGHVERAWGYSFKWSGTEAEPEAFKSTLFKIMNGEPVGHAMDYMNDRYAELATKLVFDLGEAKFDPNYDARLLATHWMANNDARGYALIGDPAVRLPLAEPGASAARGEISPPKPRPGGLPVVLSLESVSDFERPTIEAEIAAQPAMASFTATAVDSAGDGDEPPSSPAEPPVPGGAGGGGEPPSQEIAQKKTDQGGAPPAPAFSAPYASPMDGLAFAMQAYGSAGDVSFSVGLEGVSFNILDDAKNAVKDVVSNLNTALQNLSQRLLEATNQALTLEVTTSLVDNLSDFDPLKPGAVKPEARFKTTISATGDVQAFLPASGREIDVLLLQVHKDMVEQAMNNRLETAKAVGELVASLFSPGK